MVTKKTKIKKIVTPEKVIQAYFVQVARLHNFYVFRSNNNRVVGKGRFVPLPERDLGQPDAIALNKRGQVFFIEFKSSTGKQSEHQISRQKEIERNGGKYILIKSILDVTEFISINS